MYNVFKFARMYGRSGFKEGYELVPAELSTFGMEVLPRRNTLRSIVYVLNITDLPTILCIENNERLTLAYTIKVYYHEV